MKSTERFGKLKLQASMIEAFNLFIFSDIAAHDSSDRKWYLSRIRDDRCKIVQFDQNGFFEYPKPFNYDCFTQVELITAILTLLVRASIIFFKMKWHNLGAYREFDSNRNLTSLKSLFDINFYICWFLSWIEFKNNHFEKRRSE